MQSTGWARFKRAEGYDARLFGLFRDSKLIGGASLLGYPQTGGHDGFVLCPEGPVLPWEEKETARAALRGLIELAKALPGEPLGLRIQPHLPRPSPSVLKDWAKAPVSLTPDQTLLLDLTLDEETFLAQMRPKGRYNLRVAAKHGVEVRRSQEVFAMREFYRVFEEASLRNDFFAEPYSFFLNLFSELVVAGMADVFLARWQGEVLAAIIVVYFGRRATYLYGGSVGHSRQVMASYPLHTAAMAEARARGCVEYDMYGIDLFGRPDHLYAGISKFKRQWGGKGVEWVLPMDFVFYDRLAERMISRLNLPG